MKTNSKKKSLSWAVFTVPTYMIITIWLVILAEYFFNLKLSTFGIIPLSIKSLTGILTSPFIHGSIDHAFKNTIPLFVLGTLLFYTFRNQGFKILLLGTVLTGTMVWLFAYSTPNLPHIGASGVVYFLAGFLFFSGIFSKNKRLIAISLIVVFLYGGMIWGILPLKEGVSWQSHFFGFGVGLVLSRFFKNPFYQPKKYIWQHPDYPDPPENHPYWESLEQTKQLKKEQVIPKKWRELF